MKLLLRRIVGLIELSMGIGMLSLSIAYLITSGFDNIKISLNSLIALTTAIGFIYYGKKFLYKEIDLIEDRIISFDDPLNIQAFENAQHNISYLLSKIVENKDLCFVKFIFANKKNKVFPVWSNVNYRTGKVLNVNPVSPDKSKDFNELESIDIAEEDVLDWQVIDSEGNIYGNFSLLATAAKARELGYNLNRKSKKILEKIIPISL